MSACTRNSSKGFYTRLTWTSALVLFIMCLALSELRCEVSADSEVDADLVFDLDDPVIRDQETKSNGQDHRRFEKRHARRTLEKEFSASSAESQEHETVDGHWISKTVHRIKRGFLDWLTPKKAVEEVKQEDKVSSRERRNSKEEETETTDDYDSTTAGHHQEQGQHSFEEEGQHEFHEDLNEVDDNHHSLSNHGGQTSLNHVLPAYRGDTNRDQMDDEDMVESGSTATSTPRVHPVPSPETAQYYRVSLTINEPYTPSYEVKTSPEFVNLATSVSNAITQLYEDLPGQRHVTVVMIKKREIDSFTSLALVDIGTRDYYDGDAIKNRLYDQIQNYQRLGEIPVSTEEFTFTKFVEPATRCNADELQCKSGECVHVQFRCDGVHQCIDGTDEVGCATVPAITSIAESVTAPTRQDRCRADDKVKCADGSIICEDQKCDGVFDCPDHDDEDNCPVEECALGEIMCDVSRCIPESKVCDGVDDCNDGTDEECHDPCTDDQFLCDDRSCIDKSQRCDGIAQCRKGEDESGCPKCNKYQFMCASGDCIDIRYKCDGRRDCPDNSDEREDECGPGCRSDEFECDETCLPLSDKCNGVKDCEDGMDEQDCPRYCPINQFHCGGSVCISNDRVCDKRSDCSDGRDERECVCQGDEFSCTSGECIASSLICNGKPDCFDGSDEYNCPAPTTPHPIEVTHSPGCGHGQWKCRSGECIPASSVCDTRFDCNDYSDENSCSELKLKTYPDDQIIKESREVVFQCRDEGPLRARVHWLRGGNLPLPLGSKDINGRLEMPDIQVDHTGSYICEAIGYSSSTPGSRVTVSLTVEPYEHPSTRPPTACGLYEATCSNGDCIPKNQVCDGKYDCTDGSDEMRCKSGCEPNEFRCDNKRCVLKTWRCDSDDDCGDGSDERNCATNPPGSPCRYNEFPCHSGNQCIPKSFHCDLERDCQDGSDEIGCSAVYIQTPPPPMVTLDIGELFVISCTAIAVPTPEVVWRLNWGHIPPKCTTKSEGGVGTLTCPDIQESDQGAYSCEAINIRGSVFAVPDSILVVRPTGKVCPAGMFNNEAKSPSECIKCFCFGVTSECESADLFTYQLHPPLDVHKVVGVRVEPNGGVEVRDEPIYRGAQPKISSFGRNGVTFATSPYSSVDSNIVPYFAMPENYNGNQLKSYGGYLKYNLKFSGSRGPSNNAPDVILKGNGYTLLHVGRPLSPDREHRVSVRFFVGEWVKRSDGVREQLATREEIMMALASVENILMRLQYHTEAQTETTLSNIEMDSAAVRNTGQSRAAYVEECKCPIGYSGLSCENCSPGYVRHMSGPWLGKCYREDDACQPGTYGDPRRGIACEVCPCPLTNPSNQFARTCSLSGDGQVTCDCPPGYVGRRCEQCAAGYSGNPLVPGDSCKPGTCDAIGSLSTITDQDGQCPCKLYTHGPNCNQCKPNTFNLGPNNQFGCTACFCMGVTSQCTSSSWYRDQIKTSFARSRNDFKLVASLKKHEYIEDEITVNSNSREITFNDFSRRQPDTYYWSLPARYLGDLVTSYGGNLKYTLRYVPTPGGLSSRNTAPDVELISANDIKLLYFGKDQPQPNNPQTFTVPILEQYWQRSDGQKADREHLLMALADIEAILIKATYTTNTREASLVSVSLDIANERNTGSIERALAVEQCSCPRGYRGLSCEDCDVGFTRTIEGLYLGLCKECDCNGHSTECDPDEGQCIHCADNTDGEYCDVCAPGYEGNATAGTPYDCRLIDSGSQRCECDKRGIASDQCYGIQCDCKANVQGPECNICRKGTFGLSGSNPEGCSECFCSGVTDQCYESNLYTEQIPSQIIDENHGFTLTDETQRERISDGFQLNVAMNEIGYLIRPSSNDRLFWSLPREFTGDKVTSYGGKLEFMQRYTKRPQARHTPDKDVILVGNGITIYWSNPTELLPDRQNNVSVAISTSENWQRLEHHSGPRRASRDDILTALANLDAILIRASQSSDTSSTYVSDITLDTAVPVYTGKGNASQVENCRCPSGYRGPSCELCETGYYRDINDRADGPLGSCRRCTCSDNEYSCVLGPGNQVICNCKPGYYGNRCETTELPPEPEEPVSPPTPDNPTIEVSISTPSIGIIDIGSTVRLHCQARSLVSSYSPIQVNWRKDGGSLPRDRAIDDRRGYLVITDVRVSDSGVYICEATDETSIVTETITITIGNEAEAPRVSFEPVYLNVEEGDPIEIRCLATGNPRPNLVFTGGQHNRLNPEHTFQNGVFRIPYARKSDEAEYHCTATNSAGTDTKTTIIYVRAGSATPGPEPDIVPIINPGQYHGQSDVTFTLTCAASSSRQHSFIWYRPGAPIPYSSSQNNGVLVVYNPRPEDSGIYICNVTTSSGETASASARVTITSSSTHPTVHIEPDRQTISQGTIAELRCIATGTPTPSVKWTKVGGEFGPNVEETGANLRILNAQVKDRGVYVCIASNDAGLNQASAIIEVEQREPPAVEIYPNSKQTVTAGASAILQCRITNGIPTPKVWWTRANRQPFGRNVEELAGGILRFSQITMQESGEYICHAENDAGQTTAIANIDVHTLPLLTLTPSTHEYQVSEGSQVRLECRATGYPVPNVQWKKHSASVSYREEVNRGLQPVAIFEISRVSKDDEGIYLCTGINDAGRTEERIHLLVEEHDRLPERGDNPRGDTTYPESTYPPSYPTRYPSRSPLVLNSEFIVPVGSRAEMRCQVQGTSDVNLDWIRADNSSLPLNSLVQDGILYINNAQASAAGEYHCLGLVRGRVEFSVKTILRIIAPPKITLTPPKQTVRPGDDAVIYCDVSGDKPIQISWSAMSRPLPRSVQASGGSLQFYGIQVSDAGKYICKANNAAGEADAVAEVVVNEYTAQPTATSESRTQEASVGQSVEMKCRISPSYTGSRPTARWSREGSELPYNAYQSGEVLHLTNIQKDNAGKYICEVTNEHGSSRDYVELIVNDPYVTRQQPLEIEPSSDEHHLGDILDLMCHGADPDAYIIWSKTPGRLADNVHYSGSTLRITSLRPENAGVYRCEATSQRGVIDTDYDLRLIDAPLHADEPTIEIKRAPQGSSITMDCRTDLESPVTYHWSKQGENLPSHINTEVARLHLRDIKSEDAGTYICKANNGRNSIELPTVLVVTGIVPFFPQTPVSYLSLPTIPDGYLSFSIEVSFKPESSNGLILYNDQKKNGVTGDFVSVVLNDGYPEFRFNCGSGPAVIRGDKRLELEQWHTIRVTRTRKEGKMYVNRQGPFIGHAPGKFQGLDLSERLFIGGVPDFGDISKQAGSSTGFVGCISRVIISGKEHELMKDALEKKEITTCETCPENPCENKGVCQEAQTKEGYKCLCPSGFSGLKCNMIGQTCYPGACNSGRCINKENGFDCYCPMGKIGKRCERETDIYEPAFSDDAFVAYPTPKNRRLKMALKIKPADLKDGVLLYCAENEEGYGDFTSLSLKEGHVEFRFDVGNGPVIMRSANMLVPDEWVAITVSRYLGEGKLIVNGESAVIGKSQGSNKPVELYTSLYVGGYDKDRIEINSGVGVDGGFNGCISAIDVSGLNLSLVSSVVESANVQDCSAATYDGNSQANDLSDADEDHNNRGHHSQKHATGCGSNPCRNDGQCYPLSPTEYRCSCINGYSGDDCEIAPNLCDQLQPCQNGGSCNGTTVNYKCDCPLGYTGLNCEQRADIRTDVHFTGDGYLELDRSLLSHEVDEETEVIALDISTNSSDGLIFWHGQEPTMDGKGDDFIALAVVGGYLEFSFDLGSGPVTIKNRQIRIDDSRRHSVILKRQEVDGSIEVDHDFTEFGSSEGLTRTMNCRGNIYLGGTPNLHLMTGGKFTRGFSGCIHGFELQDSNTIDLGAKTLYGVNVKPCSSLDDDDDDLNGDDFVNK